MKNQKNERLGVQAEVLRLVAALKEAWLEGDDTNGYYVIVEE